MSGIRNGAGEGTNHRPPYKAATGPGTLLVACLKVLIKNQVPNATQGGMVFAHAEHAGEGKGRCRCGLDGDVLLPGQ